MVQVKLPPNI